MCVSQEPPPQDVGFVPTADARTFLGRLTHLDPAAVVRLRPAAAGRTTMWARLPWVVLVTREIEAVVPEDVTVDAAALLRARGTLPRRRDLGWRWPLPPDPGVVVERVPAARLREIAAAAAGTLRQVAQTGLAGRPVGSRVLREALLDHVAVVVEVDGGRLEVPQRLIQAVVRMGFLGRSDEPVRVRWAEPWIGLAAPYGTAWLPPPAPLAVRPAPRPPAAGPPAAGPD
jgi:hypothetical protein